MLERLAVYGLPVLAGAATALSIVGPGGARPVDAARVLGRLGPDAHVVALRVVLSREHNGEIDPLAGTALELELRSPSGERARASAVSSEAGVAELALAKPGEGPLAVRVTAGDELLAEGELRERLLAWGPPSGVLDGEHAGRVALRVRVPRGTVAPPFAEQVIVDAACDECSPAVRLRAEATGAELEPPRSVTTAAAGAFAWSFRVTVTAPTSELLVEAEDGAGHDGTWRGELPVDNGAFFLEPDTHERLVVRAPGPQRVAFLTFLAPSGRVGGRSLTLAADATGFGSASMPRSELPEGTVLVVVSSDPEERGRGTTSWPIGRADRTLDDPELDLSCDGRGAARERERNRQALRRAPFVGLIVVAGLAEMAFVWHRYRRRSGQRDPATERELPLRRSALSLVMALVGLAIAFGTLTAVAIWAAAP